MNKFNVGDKVICGYWDKWVCEITDVISRVEPWDGKTYHDYKIRRIFDARSGSPIKGITIRRAGEHSMVLAKDVFQKRIITINKMISML